MEKTKYLGFDGLNDFFTSTFGLKAAVISITSATFAAVTSIITQYVWDDARAIYVLCGLIIFDAMTGVVRSIQEKTFAATKLPRFLVNLVLYNGMLALGWNLSKISPMYFWIPGMLYGGFIATVGLSIFKDMHSLGYIPSYMHKAIMEKVGLVQTFMFGKKFQEDQFKAASETAPFGVFKVDHQGAVTFVNDTMLKISGLEKENSLDRFAWRALIHPDDFPEVSRAWDYAFSSHKNFAMRYRLMREDGEIIFVKSSATPIFDSKGKFRGYIGTLVDISDFLKTH